MHENSSTVCPDTILAHVFKYLIGTLLGFIIFFSIAGNILVCIAIYTDRRLRKMGNIFLVSLALADLFMASIVMTFAVANDMMGYWAFGPVFCDAWISMDVLSTTASILNLAAISLDRYFHIKDPLSYERWMTRRIIIGSIIIIWSLSAMVSFVPISLGWHRPPNIDMSSAMSPSVSSSSFTLSPSSASSILQSDSRHLLSSPPLSNSPHFMSSDEYHQPNSISSQVATLSSREESSLVIPLSVMNQSSIKHWWLVKNDTVNETTLYPQVTFDSLNQMQSDDRESDISPDVTSGVSSSLVAGKLEAIFRLPFTTNHKEKPMINGKQSVQPLVQLSGSERHSSSVPAMRQMDSSEGVTESSSRQSGLLFDPLSEINDDDDDDDQSLPQCALDLTPLYAVVSSAISFYIPCLIMIGLYTQLYLYAKKHVQNIRSFQVTTSNTVVDDHEAQMSSSLGNTKKRSDHQHNVTSGGNNSSSLTHHRHQVTEHKAAITLGIIMGTFLLCWVPFFIVNIIGAFCKTCIPSLLFKILTWLGYFNSAMNPVIYSIFNTEFRDAFKKILVSYVRHECCNGNYRRSSRGVHDSLVTSRPSCGGPSGGGLHVTCQASIGGHIDTNLTVPNTPTSHTTGSTAPTRQGTSTQGDTKAAAAAAATTTTNVTTGSVKTPHERVDVDSRSTMTENSFSHFNTSSSSKTSCSENGKKLSCADVRAITSTRKTLSTKRASACSDKYERESEDDDNVEGERKCTRNVRQTNGSQLDIASSVSLLTKEEEEEVTFDQTTSQLIPADTSDRDVELSYYSRPCKDHEKTTVTSTLAV